MIWLRHLVENTVLACIPSALPPHKGTKTMRKRNIPKQRNFLVPLMRLQCKPGPHSGKRRQSETDWGRDWMQDYLEELSASNRKSGDKTKLD